MRTQAINFPRQRVSEAEKQKPDWYQNCIDFVIAAGISNNDKTDVEKSLNILHGDIPNEFYKKTLNPYNATNERYTRFPATMRNLDIMSDIIRRYVSEYFKGVHEFVVHADNPEIVLKRNMKLRQEIAVKCQQAFQQEFQRRWQEMQQQAAQQGTPMEQLNSQDAMPDVDQFVKEFNEKYIDDESKQAQDLLDYIRSATEDAFIYLSAFFNYCSLGECYTYTDIRGDKLVKENIPVIEAYPIPNSEFFIEDQDMFARRMTLSYNQIMDMFGDVMSAKDREFIERYYNVSDYISSAPRLLYSQYFEYFPDACGKFNKEERNLYQQHPEDIYLNNENLFEVWHVVWKGEVRKGILTHLNELGMPVEDVVDSDYELNPEAGDISIEYVYDTQIYEGYRIGTRYTGIYPIKARPIAYERNGKLPYNGIREVLPFMGKFSIIQIITPFQIMRNIIYYHREMVIAKNKMLILLLPESLINGDEEDKIYKMAADGVLIVNDEEDNSGQKMANIRLLNASLGQYITELTNLLEAIKMEARELVDMNMQRYGEIAQSAGSTTTQEAIARSSMGSVIVVTMFDEMRCRDYQRDLDYGKLAYIDGLQTSFIDDKHTRRYISLDVNSYVNSDLGVIVKNTQKELEKIEQLRQWSFSAAQNGDLDMALAAILGENVTQIKETVQRFMEIKRQHEDQLKQADQMLEQQKLQNELAKIEAQGQQDKELEELKYYYELQLKGIDVDMSMVGSGEDTAARDRLAQISEENKTRIAEEKLRLEEQKVQVDLYNKAADRQVKREQMENQLKIAKQNKNKYDK